MLIPFGVLSAAGAGGGAVAGSYDLIQTYILGSSQSSITFSSLSTYSTTYKHLQLRIVARATNAGTGAVGAAIRFNGGGSTDYSYHFLNGNGSSVTSYGDAAATYWYMGGVFPQASATTNAFGVVVSDILDAYSTTKNKTMRSLMGVTGPTNKVTLESAAWFNTAAIDSMVIETDPASGWATGSRFSIYGIKG